MSYIGRALQAGAFRQLDDISSGFDGSTTGFTMQVNSGNVQLGDVNQILLSLGGVIQKPGTDFTISTSTLTFTTAPAANTSFFAILLGSDNGGTVTPTDGSVTPGKLSFTDGATVKFGTDSEVELTHNADKGLILKHTATGDDKPVSLTLQTGETDIAADDVIGKIEFQAPDEGTGTDANLTAAAIQTVSEGDFSSSSNASSLVFMTGSSAAAAERARMTSAGHLSVGATSITNGGGYNKVIQVSGTEGCFSAISSSGEGLFAQNGDNTQVINRVNGYMQFRTNNTERMRIFSGGGVAISRTSVLSPASGGITVAATGANTTPAMSVQANTQASSGSIIVFHKGTGGECGSIGMTNLNAGSSVSYNTSSDYRLKENVNYDFDATTRLKQLKPAVFNWIDDESNNLEDGFLAHEVSNIVPEAITGIKDETTTHKKAVLDSYDNIIAENIEEADWTEGKAADEDGNRKYPTDSTWHETKTVPKYQQIDQSKLVPLMVKTIQELEARIKILEDA